MNKKLLYLMHIDWGWAKQRPHFVAEYLSKAFDVKVFYVQSFTKRMNISGNIHSGDMNINKLYRLPMSRYGFINYINLLLAKIQISRYFKDADIVWVTHPEMFNYLNGLNFNKKTFIYDCMDDALEFPSVSENEHKRNALAKLEKILVEQSDLIFVSSNHLRDILVLRYNCKNKVFVVNNGISLPNNKYVQNTQTISFSLQRLHSIKGPKILYLGTISSWFNFDLLMDSLDLFPEITYVIVGPCEFPGPKHPRLVFLPAVQHEFVYMIMNLADVLIMPFYVNELIKSVNPVKVYEYIFSQKPSFIVSYEETKVFQDYVYLYSTADEYFDLIRKYLLGNLENKQNASSANKFLIENTWEVRVDSMVSVIQKQNTQSL